MIKDLVSIITPAFRAENLICHAVKSVLAQSYPHWEMLIVADDGCDYRQILLDNQLLDDRLRFFASPYHQSGPNNARNIGLEEAQGEWIAPLDADDIYYPERLARLMDKAAPSGLALDNLKISGEHIENRAVIERPYPEAFGFEDFQQVLVPLLFLFHRRHIHRSWDKDIVRGADTIFNLRALESAGFAGFVGEPQHEYRVHGQSMCHAEGAENIFVEAYHHTLYRLRTDGLGFRDQIFCQRVIAMIEQKQAINAAFEKAVIRGYRGNYQSFVKAQALC